MILKKPVKDKKKGSPTPAGWGEAQAQLSLKSRKIY